MSDYNEEAAIEARTALVFDLNIPIMNYKGGRRQQMEEFRCDMVQFLGKNQFRHQHLIEIQLDVITRRLKEHPDGTEMELILYTWMQKAVLHVAQTCIIASAGDQFDLDADTTEQIIKGLRQAITKFSQATKPVLYKDVSTWAQEIIDVLKKKLGAQPRGEETTLKVYPADLEVFNRYNFNLLSNYQGFPPYRISISDQPGSDSSLDHTAHDASTALSVGTSPGSSGQQTGPPQTCDTGK